MPHGGPRPGSGRKSGTKNKATIERELRAATGVSAALAGDLPLDVVLGVMRGTKKVSPDQYSAAVAALPYCHPRLTAVSMDAVVRHKPAEMTDAELLALICGRGGASKDELDRVPALN